MKKVKTTMDVVCAWCGESMGTKDGKGVTGTTHGICPKCAAKEWEKLGGKPPARWNLVGRLIRRFFARRQAERRELRRLAELDRQVNQRAEAEEIFLKNPELHARVLLMGKRGIHYISNEDLINLEEAADPWALRPHRN